MKICSVCPYSTSSPFKKNAVRSETRRACCILCVTIIIEYSLFNPVINSSILHLKSDQALKLVHQAEEQPASSQAFSRCINAAAGRRITRVRMNVNDPSPHPRALLLLNFLPQFHLKQLYSALRHISMHV